MAKFCGNCGKPLQDGETCSCSLSKVSEEEAIVQPQSMQSEQQTGASGYSYGQPMQGQPVQGQPVQGQPMQGQPVQGQPMQGQPMYGQPAQGAPNGQTNQFSQQASQAAAVAGKYAKNTWQILMDIWKAPADNLRNFVSEKNFVNALIVIGAEVLLSIIFACLVLRKTSAALMDIYGGLASLLGETYEVHYFGTVLKSLIGTALGACIFAAITMLIVKQYGKGNKTFKEALCVTATKSIALLPFLVVAIIVSIFSITPAVVVLALGGILGCFYVHTALNDGSIQDKNKQVYTTFLIIALNFIVTVVLLYLFAELK